MYLNVETPKADLSAVSIEGNERVDLTVFSSFEEMSDMQEEWDTFIDSVGGEIFLTYDWCRVWWKHYGANRNLLIFVFRHGKTVCGILPIFMEKIRLGPFYVNAVKIVGTDFVPIAITIPIKADYLSQIIQQLLYELNKRFHWDILHIGPICGRYGAFEILSEACIRLSNSYKSDFMTSDVHTYFELAETWEKQLASLNKKQRSNMRRQYEKIFKLGTPLECRPASTDNFKQMFNNFVELHQSHWQSLGKPGHFGAWPESYQFHQEVAAAQLYRKRLRLYEIDLDNKCIGYSYAYKFGNTYYRFLYARASSEDNSKYDFAKIDYGEMFKRALKENVTWFDSMRGKYDFKQQLGGKLLPIKNIYIYSNRFLSKIKTPLFRSSATLLDIIYSKLWRARVAPVLGITLGHFQQAWLRSCMFTYLESKN